MATNTQTFTSSGTWTRPLGTTSMEIVIRGGGAGGSGGGVGLGSDSGGGGGGGEQGAIHSNIRTSIPNAITVTIGAGGSPHTDGGSSNALGNVDGGHRGANALRILGGVGGSGGGNGLDGQPGGDGNSSFPYTPGAGGAGGGSGSGSGGRGANGAESLGANPTIGNSGSSGIVTITATIPDPIPAPSLPSAGPYTRVGPGTISRTLPAASDGTSPLVYSAVGSISSFNASTRAIVVNLSSAPSTITVAYTVTDADGRSDTIQVVFSSTSSVSNLTLPNVGNITRTQGGPVYASSLPAASGGTTPYTYSVTGRPSWLGFNSFTRTFTGTESVVGSWTLTYRVTDSGSPQQSASRSFTYTVNASTPSLSIPNFSDDTGNAQAWTQGTAISPITVPAASGNPTPTYSLVSGPSGISFNTSTRRLSGTPTGTGSGTIRIRASNSQGSDDWTVGYTVTAMAPDPVPPVLPSAGPYSSTSAGQMQTLPAATSGDTPISYGVTESDADGQIIGFSTNSRIINIHIPTAPATLTVTYTATNSAGSVSRTVLFHRTVAALPNASAPSISIASVISVDEDDILNLSASVSGGTYDAIGYAWTVVSGGGSISGNGLSATYSPPNVSSDQSVTVRVTANVTGNGTNAASGTSDSSSDTEFFIVNVVIPPLPNANAPSISISSASSVDEDDTLSLLASIGVGTYDTLSYVWFVAPGYGGSISGNGLTATYTPPNVSSNQTVLVEVQVTATGTGTNAASGTSDMENDLHSFTVNVVLPNASAPSVNIAAISSVDEDDTLSLSASISGGTYDSISYFWSVVSGGGSINGFTDFVSTYIPPNVSSNRTVIVRLTVTVGGNGTNAASGTTDSSSDTESFTVNVVTAPPPTLVLPDPSNINRTEGGAVYSTPLPAASGGTGSYSYSVLGRPSFMGFNSSTRQLTGTESSTGSWTLTYRVTSGSQTASQPSPTRLAPLRLQSTHLCSPLLLGRTAELALAVS